MKKFLGSVIVLTLMLAAVAQAEERQLFRYDGLDYDTSDLDPTIQNELFLLQQEHYDKLRALFDRALLELHIQEQADTEKQSREAIAKKLFPVEPPTKADVEVFYKANKDRIRGDLEQVGGQIAQYLMNEKRRTLQTSLLGNLKELGDYKILVAAPEPPILTIASDGYPSKGAKDAKVTIVEFADYRCPHCKTAGGTVKKVLGRFPDQVKVVYMDMPVVQGGTISTRIAEGAVCADSQEKFWDYHDLAFERQEGLTMDSPLVLAKALKLDENLFKACLDASDTKTEVAKAKAEGERIGVTGTPTFFVNGKRIVTDDLEAGLVMAIEAAL